MIRLYRISKSPIHGVGVFARVSFDKSHIIDHLHTKNVGWVSDYTDLPTVGVVQHGHIYVPLDGFPLWAVNYSDRPNITATPFGVYALRSIRVGDELTIQEYKR